MIKITKKINKVSGFIVTMTLVIGLFLNSNIVYADYSAELQQVKYLIGNVYINDVHRELLESDNIDEIIKGVKDPYTQYFSKEEFKNFQMAINNSFSGIGIYQEENLDGLKIIGLLEESPAKKAGLKKDDIILKVDGNILKGLTVEESSKYLRGESGTTANIEIKRDKDILNFNVKREEIDAPTVQSSILDDHIGYIAIQSFGQNTPNLFEKELKKIMRCNIDKIIVDLRNNTGGYTDSAYNIAGYFIGEDTVIRMRDKAGRTYYYKAVPHNMKINIPTVFLINEYTASASEILSSAVKDYKKAFFIGRKSFGKGVQQTIFTLADEGILKLTTNEFYSPVENNKIQKTGIMPDFNTKKINPLSVAYLLFSGNDKTPNKRNLIKVNLKGNDFTIDLNKGSNKQFRQELKYIIDNSTDDYIHIGIKNGWVKIKKQEILNDSDLYFRDFNNLKILNKSRDDVSFKVKFNKEVDLTTINKENIRLIDSYSFKQVNMNYKVDGNNLNITLDEKSNVCGKYYLVLEDIKSTDGKKLRRNSIITVNIE